MQEAGTIELSTELQQLITAEQAWHYRVLPQSKAENQLTFWVDASKSDFGMADELEILLGQSIVLEKAPADRVQEALARYYRKTRSGQATAKSAQLNSRKADSFLEELIQEAKDLGSSDIHLEVYEESCRVRIRIDGQLIERYTIEKGEYPALVNRIKIRSHLDIAEKRLPQDGRIFFRHFGSEFDIRVSVLPTMHGEKIVMRILSNDATHIDIAKLGFGELELERYQEGIKRPNGIVLISGPTGSGKTTTLYATLKILNKTTTNVLTIEDPIEYTLKGINQVQVKENIGLSFAAALRSFLRQDPDIIMLGEIRDGETANMAIRAALTGHLVLSTIHTNSAWGTVSRLVDMGVPSFLLASTLNTTVAQRLVRLLCPDCKEQRELTPKLLPSSFEAPRPLTHHHVAVGCENCYFTGYRGRKALYEVIPIDQELSNAIKSQRFEVSEHLDQRNIKSLRDNAFELLEQGRTSIDEVYPLLLTTT